MRGLVVVVSALALTVGLAGPAGAAFPYSASDPKDYTTYKLPPGANQTPNDLSGKLEWMYAATADPVNLHLNSDKRELNGVRGAHVADAADVDQAWRTTTGRPDVTIAVLDSGIKWNSGDMRDLRKKTRLNKGELPRPLHDRAEPLEAGQVCSSFVGDWDANGDGVFNIVDYACDSRVELNTPKGVGPNNMLEPQDVLIAFTDGSDADSNGYKDDIVGWDFLDDDNDPFDDVEYGHGTGEARDSGAEADNGSELGTCPNCMQIHMRVGTSFIADVNRFALAVIYAVDNDVLVVQEALGTLNKSRLGADAVKYAYDHGVVVIASAADEAAQHHNWPSSYPYSIVVNSNTNAEDGSSYLKFNGCTNFSSRITLAIPSVSCSSDATGRASGMAGLVYSAALNAIHAGTIDRHPTCKLTSGEACPISANEVRQIMASGLVDGVLQADDVNFAQDPVTGASTELSCQPVPVEGCTDPFAAAPGSTVPRFTSGRSYPARKGHDQFYGYGRVNMNKAVDAVAAGDLPPEVEVTSPNWFDMIDPTQSTFAVDGQVFARGAEYTCQVLVAAGSYPSDFNDFVAVDSPWCDGTTKRTGAFNGRLANVSTVELEALFPANAGDFTGREPGTGEQTHSGRPNTEPYGFTVKVVAKAGDLTGQDRRQAYLHRDAEMLAGFPIQLPGDGEASPALADLDGDNRNELVIANSDGLIYAFKRNGSQLAGFPVEVDPIPHQTSRAFTNGDVQPAAGAILASPAIGDLDRDGVPEIVVADLESKVYVISDKGDIVDRWTSHLPYDGRPSAPFVNERKGKLNRTQPGFIGSPVIANMDADADMEIVAAAMDRHLYVWDRDGTDLPGWPRLVVDMSKVASVDEDSHQVTFKSGVGADFEQGAIIDTPAVGNIDADPQPEIVIGTNEAYREVINAGGFDERPYRLLGEPPAPGQDPALETGNGRLYAFQHDGTLVAGWPFKVGILQAGVLPLVGEGITGSPIIGRVDCQGSEAPRVGVIPAAGLPYLVNGNGESCYGRTDGKDVALPTSGGAATDQPFIAAFGHPAFGTFGDEDVMLAPAAGLQRAADVILPEYQGGHDYLVAWNTDLGKVQPGWPAEVNDLQFLTGPSLADIDGTEGEEVLTATASDDLQGLTPAGTDAGPAWPKLTGDWTVANPAIGSFGDGANQVIVSLTRSGRVLAYETAAPVCSSASWPRFHHDIANSGSLERDAVAPGSLRDVALTGKTVSFKAPGDDLLCGTAARYEVAASNSTPSGSSGREVSGAPAPAAPGSSQSIDLSSVSDRWVAIRAVDEAGNVSRAAVVELNPPGPRPHHPASPMYDNEGDPATPDQSSGGGGSSDPSFSNPGTAEPQSRPPASGGVENRTLPAPKTKSKRRKSCSTKRAMRTKRCRRVCSNRSAKVRRKSGCLRRVKSQRRR